MYYSSFGMLAMVLHLIINHEVMKKNTEGKGSAAYVAMGRYRHFLWSVLVYYFSDIMWGILYERGNLPLVYADTVLYFAAMVVSVLLWTRFVVAYLDRKVFFDTVLTYAGWMILIYEMICLIINFFKPIIFSFDAENVYQPGVARYATLGFQIILFLGASLYSILIAARSEGKIRIHHGTIGCSGVVMAFFIVLQTMFPLVPFYAIGCLIGTCLIHTFVAVDEKMDHLMELGFAKQKAYTDSLTGVKNMHAYAEAKEILEEGIKDGTVGDFGVIVFDINGLKMVNDSLGHDEGDKFIKNATNDICQQFKHSPVFRIGGDEFVILLQGEDYRNRDQLIGDFEKRMAENEKEGKAVISEGLSIFNPEKDEDFDAVFGRADRLMYEHKRRMKGFRG